MNVTHAPSAPSYLPYATPTSHDKRASAKSIDTFTGSSRPASTRAPLSPFTPNRAGVSARNGGSLLAQRTETHALAIEAPSDRADAAALEAAVAFLTSRYAPLLPSSRTRVVVRDPGEGLDGATYPPTGTVTLRPGLGAKGYAGTLAHELMHSRAGFSGRVKQNLADMSGHDEEHQFLHELGSAVSQHFALEQQLGRAATNAELMQWNPIGGVVEYEAGGAPFLVRRRAVNNEVRVVELHLPSWSAVRASFEKGGR